MVTDGSDTCGEHSISIETSNHYVVYLKVTSQCVNSTSTKNRFKEIKKIIQNKESAM